jgi:hypothetical protein
VWRSHCVASLQGLHLGPAMESLRPSTITQQGTRYILTWHFLSQPEPSRSGHHEGMLWGRALLLDSLAEPHPAVCLSPPLHLVGPPRTVQ